MIGVGKRRLLEQDSAQQRQDRPEIAVNHSEDGTQQSSH